MLRPTATDVEALENYRLLITFDTGEKKIFDVKPYIKGGFMGKLSDRQYFTRVKTDGVTVAWPNEQDICPDALYYDSIPIENVPGH